MKQIIILIGFLIFAALANAQTKTDSLRKVIEDELRPKIAQELATEIPYVFECYFQTKRKSGPVFFIEGFVKGGQPYDSKHKPLDPKIVIINAIPIKPQKP